MSIAVVLSSQSRRESQRAREIRHPLAKFLFRSLYADSAARGRIASREIGTVFSRDILGEPGTLENPASRLLKDVDEDVDVQLEQTTVTSDRDDSQV